MGISRDTSKKQKKFKDKYDLPFPLLADPEAVVQTSYGVWKEKNMYGKKVWGAVRSTFLIDKKGKIEQIWYKVKVKEHVKTVLEAL